MKILITGGAGFIGSNLTNELIRKGYYVVVLDHFHNSKVEDVNEKAKIYIMDILDEGLLEVFERESFDIVFHLAAQIDIQKSIQNPIEDASTNILGTLNILDACVKTKVKKIIFSSSAAVYGRPEYLAIDEKHPTKPIAFYGTSKLACEYYIKSYAALYDIDYTILRYANVYGLKNNKTIRGGVISNFISRMTMNQQPIIYGDGTQIRDYIYVMDIVNANINAMSRGGEEIINVGTGQRVSLNKLYSYLTTTLNVKVKPLYMEPQPGDIKMSYFNIEKSNYILQWQPNYLIEVALGEMIKLYNNNIDNIYN